MININRYTLSNGLRVIHNEDNTTQMVALNLLYDVGARDEDPDHTGFAHLFEHLMFGGIIRDTGAFDYLVGIQNEFFGMVSFFPGNLMAVEKFLILVLDSGHVRNKRLKSFDFSEYGCTCAAFASS